MHLIRNTLHCAIAYANFAADLDDALAGPQTIFSLMRFLTAALIPRRSERLAARYASVAVLHNNLSAAALSDLPLFPDLMP